METTVVKKRKVIDIDDHTFKVLSVSAALKGTNLKAFIEKALSVLAENIEERDLYAMLVNEDAASKQYLNREEKEMFEKFLDL